MQVHSSPAIDLHSPKAHYTTMIILRGWLTIIDTTVVCLTMCRSWKPWMLYSCYRLIAEMTQSTCEAIEIEAACLNSTFQETTISSEEAAYCILRSLVVAFPSYHRAS